MRPKTALLLASAAGTFVCAVLGAPSSAQAVPTQVLWYRFDNHSLGAQPATFTNSGALGTSVTSTTHRQVATSPNADHPATIVNGVSSASGSLPSGRAIDLPPYQPLSQTSKPSLSVIGVRNNSITGTDPMNPGTGNFTWKADFSLDDYLGSQADDGDNIVQRGLYSATGYLWKMSADGHKYQCAVKAPATNEIRTTAIMIPNKTSNRSWYRGSCNRSGAGVLTASLQAYDKAQGAWVSVKTVTQSGAGVNFTSMPKSTAVSIGGKLDASRTTGINSDPDQFNGVIDNVTMTVG